MIVGIGVGSSAPIGCSEGEGVGTLVGSTGISLFPGVGDGLGWELGIDD